MSLFTKETAAEAGRTGGKKSGAQRRARRAMKEKLEALLSARLNGQDVGETICLALIEKALAGDVKAFEVIRDTIGEKPCPAMQPQADTQIAVTWK